MFKSDMNIEKVKSDAFIIFSDFAFVRQTNNGVNSLYVADLKDAKNRVVFLFDNKREEFNMLSSSFSLNSDSYCLTSRRLHEMLSIIERNKKYMVAGVYGNALQ